MSAAAVTIPWLRLSALPQMALRRAAQACGNTNASHGGAIPHREASGGRAGQRQ